ncbi:p24 complex component [Coelomomyces lativittatus]|nr:p24 complex component [Coelomomyces lativittatus]
MRSTSLTSLLSSFHVLHVLQCFFVWIGFISLFSTSFMSVQGLSAHLRPNERLCLFEDVKGGTRFTISFQIGYGGDPNIIFWVSDPAGTSLYTVANEHTGNFEYTAVKDGAYTYCFTNHASVSIVNPVFVPYFQNHPHISSTDTRLLLRNVTTLAALHKDFLAELEQTPLHVLPILFLNYSPRFLEYQHYCSPHDEAMQVWKRQPKQIHVVTSILVPRVVDKEEARLAMTDVFMKPIQRITKYPLFLHQLNGVDRPSSNATSPSSFIPIPCLPPILSPSSSLTTTSQSSSSTLPTPTSSPLPPSLFEQAKQAMQHVLKYLDQARWQYQGQLRAHDFWNRVKNVPSLPWSKTTPPTISLLMMACFDVHHHILTQTTTTTTTTTTPTQPPRSEGHGITEPSTWLLHPRSTLSPSSSSMVQVRALGCFLFANRSMVGVKPKKKDLYHVRYVWQFTVEGWEVVELMELPKMYYGFRLQRGCHVFDFLTVSKDVHVHWLGWVYKSLYLQSPTKYLSSSTTKPLSQASEVPKRGAPRENHPPQMFPSYHEIPVTSCYSLYCPPISPTNPSMTPKLFTTTSNTAEGRLKIEENNEHKHTVLDLKKREEKEKRTSIPSLKPKKKVSSISPATPTSHIVSSQRDLTSFTVPFSPEKQGPSSKSNLEKEKIKKDSNPLLIRASTSLGFHRPFSATATTTTSSTTSSASTSSFSFSFTFTHPSCRRRDVLASSITSPSSSAHHTLAPYFKDFLKACDPVPRHSNPLSVVAPFPNFVANPKSHPPFQSQTSTHTTTTDSHPHDTKNENTLLPTTFSSTSSSSFTTTTVPRSSISSNPLPTPSPPASKIKIKGWSPDSLLFPMTPCPSAATTGRPNPSSLVPFSTTLKVLHPPLPVSWSTFPMPSSPIVYPPKPTLLMNPSKRFSSTSPSILWTLKSSTSSPISFTKEEEEEEEDKEDGKDHDHEDEDEEDPLSIYFLPPTLPPPPPPPNPSISFSSSFTLPFDPPTSKKREKTSKVKDVVVVMMKSPLKRAMSAQVSSPGPRKHPFSSFTPSSFSNHVARGQEEGGPCSFKSRKTVMEQEEEEEEEDKAAKARGRSTWMPTTSSTMTTMLQMMQRKRTLRKEKKKKKKTHKSDEKTLFKKKRTTDLHLQLVTKDLSFSPEHPLNATDTDEKVKEIKERLILEMEKEKKENTQLSSMHPTSSDPEKGSTSRSSRGGWWWWPWWPSWFRNVHKKKEKEKVRMKKEEPNKHFIDQENVNETETETENKDRELITSSIQPLPPTFSLVDRPLNPSTSSSSSTHPTSTKKSHSSSTPSPAALIIYS